MHRISYTADGTADSFAFAFPFFQPADVRVALNGEILNDTQYNLGDWENRNGGIIVFAAPPAANTVIDIFRKISTDRFIDYQPLAKIDPEKLNEDFNFLLEAFRDLEQPNIDIAEWQNTHAAAIAMIEYTKNLIENQLSGGAFMGLHENLLGVLAAALPNLRNDCGQISDLSQLGNPDDYGSV